MGQVTMQEITLNVIEGLRGIYHAIVGGKKSVVMLAQRNRAKAENKYESIRLSNRRLKAARELANTEKLPMIVAAEVRIQGRLSSSWVATPEQYRKHKVGALDFGLSEEARKAYQGDVKFQIRKGV